MSERTMQAQRAQDLANRREVAAFRLANAAAFAANMLTAEMHEPGRLSVRRDLWNALDEWRKLHGLPDGWPIDERLATPEPRGEGNELWREIDSLLARLERYEFDTAGESEAYWTVVAMRDRIGPLVRRATLEAQGEGWQVTEPARDIVRREMPETRATVREAIRAARRGEGGGE